MPTGSGKRQRKFGQDNKVGVRMSMTMKSRPTKLVSSPKVSHEPFDPMGALVSGSASLVRSKRKPKLMIGGVGVLLVGSLTGALMMSRGGEQRTALVAATDIGVGEVITSQMLRVVRVARDTDIRSMSGGEANQLINGVASVPIEAGSTISLGQVNRTQTAPEGTVLIGAVLEAGALPSPDLRFGDKVQILVASPNGGVDHPSKIATEAVVWRVWGTQSSTGSRRAITLAVPAAATVEVGTAAAQNSIRLVLVPNRRAADAPGWPSKIETPTITPTSTPASTPALTTEQPIAQQPAAIVTSEVGTLLTPTVDPVVGSQP